MENSLVFPKGICSFYYEYVNICIYNYYVCMYVCMCVCMHVCMHTCMPVYM